MSDNEKTARRLRCLGHVINLAAKAFLYGTDTDAFEKELGNAKEVSDLNKELNIWRKRGPVGKLHNVVMFICRTPQRREFFGKIKGFTLEEGANFDHLNLVTDNATRWNSLYAMINRALKLRERIDSYCVTNASALHGALKTVPLDQRKDRLLKNDILTGDDWEALIEVKAILSKFYDFTMRAEGTKLQGDRGVLSDYMTTLNSLLNHVRAYRADLDTRADDSELSTDVIKHLRTCIVNCWCKLDDYFAIIDNTPAAYASVVTTPHMKWFYFQYTWKNATTWKYAKEPEKWLSNGEAALQSL